MPFAFGVWLNFDIIQSAIDEVGCADSFFTFGGVYDSHSDNVNIENPTGLYCTWGGVTITNDVNLGLAGFWVLWEHFFNSISISGLNRSTNNVRDIGDFYSYQIDRGIWTKFTNMNVRDSAIHCWIMASVCSFCSNSLL